jgi:hypothetical protein
MCMHAFSRRYGLWDEDVKKQKEDEYKKAKEAGNKDVSVVEAY